MGSLELSELGFDLGAAWALRTVAEVSGSMLAALSDECELSVSCTVVTDASE